MVSNDKVKEITDGDFDATIEKGVALVDFWASWCMPCRMQGPILDTLAEKLGDTYIIGKLNVDENPSTPTKFNVTGIPTLIIYKDGEVVKRFVGVQNQETLEKELKAAEQA
jgi:thioredoxin 1